MHKGLVMHTAPMIHKSHRNTSTTKKKFSRENHREVLQ